MRGYSYVSVGLACVLHYWGHFLVVGGMLCIGPGSLWTKLLVFVSGISEACIFICVFGPLGDPL